MKKVGARLMVLVILALFGLSGCTAARQPAKKPAPPRATQSSPRTTAPGATADRAMVDRVAGEARRVSGVKDATVVIAGRTAYIGLTLNPRVDKTRTTAIKKDVANRVKSAEPGLTRVNVTSDPDLVIRLKRIADGIKKGKPISSFSSELAEIGRRITPKMK